MALDVRRQREPEINVERVQDEERLFGGDIVLWVLLFILSLPVLLFGISLSPDTLGFLIMIVGGLVAGISFTQIMMRMPFFTHRFIGSVIILIVVAAIFMGIGFVYSQTLPVPTAPQDVTFEAPQSNG